MKNMPDTRIPAHNRVCWCTGDHATETILTKPPNNTTTQFNHRKKITMSNIPAEQLIPGTSVAVVGTTTYSRLASLIDGPELERRMKQQSDRGSLYPVEVPHTTIDLLDPQIKPADPSGQLNINEQFIQSKFYDRKNGQNAGHKGYNIDDKSKSLPTVFAPSTQNPGTYEQLVLENDLAAGLQVMVIIDVFTSKDRNGRERAKKGLGMNQVVVLEEPKFYVPGVNTEALAAHGITISGPVVRQDGSAAAATVGAAEQYSAPLIGEDENTAVAAPAAPAQQAPQPQAQPAPQAQAPAPAQPQAPAPQPAAQAPAPVQQAPAPQGQAPQAAGQQLTTEQLQALLAERQGAQQGGQSAFGAQAPQQAQPAQPQQSGSPWSTGSTGIAYNG